MIVDDVPQVRKDLRTLLSLADEVEVVGEAVNGWEAIRLAGVLHPDVILMDLEMPVLDGYEAAHQIKEMWPECKVIALTIHGYEAAREKAAQAKFDAFVVKGAPVETIIQLIIEAVGATHRVARHAKRMSFRARKAGEKSRFLVAKSAPRNDKQIRSKQWTLKI
jgi:DNA-binding NarL/FixJ family response regulator